MAQTTDTLMNDEEADQLLRSVNKTKEETNDNGSVKEKLLSPNTTNNPLDFDCSIFNNIPLENEQSNPENHPNFIPISG